jgi:hypothetical protein
VQFNLADFALAGSLTNRTLHMTPLTSPLLSGSTVVSGDRRSYNTGTNQSVTASNVSTAIYKVELVGDFKTTVFNILVPDTNTTVIASELVVSAVSVLPGWLNGQFVQKTNSWSTGQVLTNAAFRGSTNAFQFTNGALAGYVLTTDGTNWFAAAAAAGGGSGVETNQVLTNLINTVARNVTNAQALYFDIVNGTLFVTNTALSNLVATRAITNVSSTFGVLASDVLYAPATITLTNVAIGSNVTVTSAVDGGAMVTVRNTTPTQSAATTNLFLEATDGTANTVLASLAADGSEAYRFGATAFTIGNIVSSFNIGSGVTLNHAGTWADGVRQTFNPNATTPGLNVGSHAGDPSGPSNGDMVYNSSLNALRARINGSWVSLGAGGGGTDDTKIATNNGTGWGITLRGTIDRPVTAPTAVGGVVIFDFTNTANMFYTMNSNVTFVVSNLTAGGRGTITITNTGSFIGTWSQFNSNNWAGRYVPAVPPNYWCIVEVSRSKTDGTMTNLVMSGSEAPITLGLAVSDETTSLTTGNGKITFRMPHSMTLTEVRANLNTASSSGIPTVDINEGGVTILSTKLTIDANEKTSITAATPPVISDASLADDAEITVDIDVAGTGAKGLKIWLIGTRPF